MRLFPLVLAVLPLAVSAQNAPAALAGRFAGMTAVTGYERAMADSVLALLPGAARDRAGNAVLRIGSGAPSRLVACALDEPGFVVGAIGADGYLTLHRVGGRVPPLFDQQLEGQRVTVWGSRGGVPGVVAVRSVHLTRGRTTPDEPFTADNAYIDLGAATAAEVDGLGVRVLSAVALAKRPHRYGDSLLAAPSAGRRAACAALVAAARGLGTRTARPPAGTTVIAFVVEQNLSARGLLTAAHEYGPFTETLIVDGGATAPGAADAFKPVPDTLAARGVSELGNVSRMTIGTRYTGTPVETVSLADASALAARITEWIGGAP